jgi:hypothetical protein
MADIIVGIVVLGSLSSLAFGFLIYDIYDNYKKIKNNDIEL